MGFDGVVLETEGPISRVRLSRPEKRNALSLTMLEALHQALRAVPPSARVVILESDGPVFSAGHDLGEMIDRPADFYAALFGASAELMEGLHRIPQPVIAKVQGPATAAGCQLVASCDLAVAADHAWFATPGVRIGLFCTTPMVPVLRAVGRKRAMEMLLTGEPIDAETAVAWGLVNRAVPADELEEAVAELAASIVQYSGETIAIGKRAFYTQADLPEPAAYEVARPIMTANAATDDAQEGMSAFVEKRSPQWSGHT